MNKNILLALAAAGVGAYAVGKLLSKPKYSAEELEKINEYKQYLEDKNYVITKKGKKEKSGLNLFSVSMIPTYYKAAKTVAKYLG